MKIKGFLKDVGGASRVTKRRLAAFEQASVVPQLVDPIGDVAREWHPGTLELVVSDIRSASPTAKTVRFERADGKKLPFFYAGQYISLAFNMEGRIVCRPYSISSAPFEARAEKPFVEITVRRSKGDGYISDYINDSLKELSSSIQLVSTNTKEVQEKFNAIFDLAQTVMRQEDVIMNAMNEQAEGNKQVLDAIKNINSSSSGVKKGSVEMVAGSEQIKKEMENLSVVTKNINAEMLDMTSSMQGISAAISKVSESSEMNQKQMMLLAEQIGAFKL